MNVNINDSLKIFHPLIQKWFKERVGTPTDIQLRSWPEIAKGNHVLVTAPTGSGKTLTAFLWAINNFLTTRQPLEKQRVLYISPLKALNNDIQRNLESPLSELQDYFAAAGEYFPEIHTAVRSGDTEPSERRQMLRHPPEIFITTPESLNVLLSSKGGQRMLSGVSTVILDEIHAVAPTKRGTYLITAVERLVPLCGEFQRIALSATVKPLEITADFVGGYELKIINRNYEYQKRRVSIIQSDIRKKYEIAVSFPAAASNPGKNADSIDSKAWWSMITRGLRQEIAKNRSSLFFANSRRIVEKIARFLNETEGPRVYSHHGSLSKEIRSVVEKRFKEGELSAIISTSSLELGIDIGTVDEVVLLQAPFSIASTLQRIGRSGHGVGQASHGVFFPLHTRNLVESAVIAANIETESIESITPIESPLDVLAQVLLSMTVLESRNIDELYAEIRAGYPYHHLNRKEFDLVIDMLAGRFADARIRELKPRLIKDRVKNTVKARENAPMLLFLSGGVIPDRGYYNLRLADTKAKIGELDEEFVWERSLGDTFPLGNQVWRIQRITHNDVEVSQVTQNISLVPFWRAEEINRSYHLSEKIGLFLEEIDEVLSLGNLSELRKKLQAYNHMTEVAAAELINFLKRQRTECHAPLPHRHHVLVEHFQDPANIRDTKQTVLHTLWGGHVNRPLAIALTAAWEEKYHYPLEIFVNNDCLLLNLPHEFGISDVLTLVQPGRIRQLLRTKLESTAYFGARFRENAQCALLLPKQGFHKRMPLWLNRLRSKKLLEAVSQYEDFPILLETWRSCMNYDFEVETLLQLLEEIASGLIQVSEVITEKPSPFADGIIWRQTNQYMYEDDSPRSKLRTSLSDALLKEVMYSSNLRPRFPEEMLLEFQQKLHRTAPGYAPETAEELLQWVRERLYIPTDEWHQLLSAVTLDYGLNEGDLTHEIADRLYYIENKETLATHEFVAVIALENLPRIYHALGIESLAKDARQVAQKFSLVDIFNDDPDDVLVSFLSEWLRYYGPVRRDFLLTNLGLPAEQLAEALEILIEDGHIISDEFREQTPGPEEICDTGNLEILLRMRRAKARPVMEPLEIEALPLFLAIYQGLVSPGDGLEDLQKRLEHLFGYPGRAGIWETDILPARLSPYYTSWLDTVMRDHGLLWFGCGKERISFCFETDYELFINFPNTPFGIEKEEKRESIEIEEIDEEEKEPAGTELEDLENNRAQVVLKKIFSEIKGKFSLEDLIQAANLPSHLLTSALWNMAWTGLVTNDHFKSIRNAVMNRFKTRQISGEAGNSNGYAPYRAHSGSRRFSLNRWQSTRAFTGNWYALDIPEAEAMDALDRQELVKDRIRMLFSRYGILFRELLWNELPVLRWSQVFPVLRLMELSGEIVSGHFFKGVPGLQFCMPSVLGILTNGLAEDAIYWMNAADPASVCGIGLDELRPLLPHRLATTHVVFHGKKLTLISKRNGKELIFHEKPDHPHIQDYLEFFKVLVGREFQPLKYISVETVNDEPVLDSPYKQVLHDFGFQKDYKSMTLMKKY
ncbi:MAG: DEAD/DEAH box helicase [Acidobacteria bacterium]|nr:DEAD/DEAH box helicase [Acidobacteriota bacterium]